MASNSIFLGTKADLFVGPKFGCTVAAVNDLFLGLKSSISTALSNTINLGGSVNLTCADSISMGTGTQVSMFKKKNHVAQEEMTLSGGMAEVHATAASADDEVQRITTEVVSVLCGSLMTLAAAGITTNTDADIVEKYPGMSSCMTTVSSAVTVGDEAGTAGGGVAGGQIMGEAKFTSGSTKVKMEGSAAVYFGGITSQNANNAVGSVLSVSQCKVSIMS